MEIIAVKELGLQPDEFFALSLQEFQWLVDGFRTRDAQRQEPFRMLYYLIYNVNAKKGKTYSQIKREWPLYTDGAEDEYPDIEVMNQAWERLKSASDGTGRDKSIIGE